MKKKELKERISTVIEERRKQLLKEIELFQAKVHDTESYWGFNGPYSRQAAALEKREKQLEELEDFAQQLRNTKKTRKVGMYVFGCHKCNSITMVSQPPFDDWHECPVCRNMVYLKNLPLVEFQIVDTGEEWTKLLREAVETEGR